MWRRVLTKGMHLAAFFALGTALAGCSISGSGLDDQADAITTGSIGTPSASDQLNPSDWNKIQEIVAYAATDETAGQPVPWENTETGSTGSLMAFAAPNDGRGLCRNFAATIQDISGIHRYVGETCKGPRNAWRIMKFDALDAQ